MSQTYIAIVINLLVTFLPKFGVVVGTEEVTSIVQAAVALGTGVWIIVRRYQAGGVSVAGIRK